MVAAADTYISKRFIYVQQKSLWFHIFTIWIGNDTTCIFLVVRLIGNERTEKKFFLFSFSLSRGFVSPQCSEMTTKIRMIETHGTGFGQMCVAYVCVRKEAFGGKEMAKNLMIYILLPIIANAHSIC